MRTALLDLLRCPRSGAPLTLARAIEADEHTVTYGILSAEGFTYPVLSGVPVLRAGVGELVDLVERGLLRDATAHAALGDVPRSRVLPFVSAASEIRWSRPVARTGERRIRAAIRRADVRRLYGDPPAADIAVDPLRPLFLGHRRPNEDGYRYFRYRFGIPRYLVALALLDALPGTGGAALDVGCGAGHLAWALSQRFDTVVGIDPSFGQLLAAASLVPSADFVCADGRCLPLARGAFGVVLSSDVLPYVAEKRTAASELSRVVHGDGNLVMTALRNSAREHVHAGEPLRPHAWAALVEDLAQVRLVGDDAVLDAYLAGDAPGGLDRTTAETSQTVSVVAGHRPVRLAEGAWTRWPHALGPLRPHPLLRPVAREADATVYERRFPSETFAVDNRRIEEYLPERCVIPDDIASGEAADGAHDDRLRQLIESVALLAMPAGGGHRPEDSAAGDER